MEEIVNYQYINLKIKYNCKYILIAIKQTFDFNILYYLIFRYVAIILNKILNHFFFDKTMIIKFKINNFMYTIFCVNNLSFMEENINYQFIHKKILYNCKYFLIAIQQTHLI